MTETGATSDKLIPSKEEMECMFKRFTHLVNTKDFEELRSAMDQLPEETDKELISKSKTNKNLLFQACFSKATQIVEYFIVKYKADVNEVAIKGHETLTALFIAIKTCNNDLINLLLNHGADINWRDPENRSAIVYACYHNKMEAADTLKKRGANINDDENLILCANSLSYFKRALKLGADVDHIDESGETILMKAVVNGNIDIVNLLLKKKANFYLRSYFTGINALDIAHIFEKEDVLDCFKMNSAHSLADKVISYVLCGALYILIQRDVEMALKFWSISEKLYTKHYATILLLVKDNPALDMCSDIATEEFASGNMSLVKCFQVSLNIVCRTIEVNHPFVFKSFALLAHNPIFLNAPLTFDNLRDFGRINSASLIPLCNGVFIGMTGAVSMCEKQLLENTGDVDSIVLFIEQMVGLITKDFSPIMKLWPSNAHAFKLYKQLLLCLLHLIEYVVDVGCSDNDKLNSSIENIAKLYLFSYPTSMLLIAIERGFSFKTVLHLTAVGADVNARDYLQNTPLHLLAEQPDHFPSKVDIRLLLIYSGAKTDATNSFGVKPRVSLIEM